MDRCAEGPQSSRSTSFEDRYAQGTRLGGKKNGSLRLRSTSFEDRLAARDLRTAELKARTRETG